MTHECSCGQHATPALLAVRDRREARPAVSPTDTVADVSRRSPRALEALQRLGVNHCCGAHLTLTEAAAAAGVTVGTLIQAIEAALAEEAPSR